MFLMESKTEEINDNAKWCLGHRIIIVLLLYDLRHVIEERKCCIPCIFSKLYFSSHGN